MERLLLISLRILRAVNQQQQDQSALGKRLLKLAREREALLAALPGTLPQSTADKARWELVRYVNRITKQKITAKI
jgi:hypothetical protein